MRSDDRAVSEVLGFALVFALVVSTVAIVSLGGLGTLQDARDAEQVNNAERAFDVLADNMNDISQERAPSRATEISLASAQVLIADPVEVTFRGYAGPSSPANFSETYDVSPIVYRADSSQTEVVYVAGAVFRTQPDGSLVLRRPAIRAAEGQVVVPLIQTRSRAVQSFSGGTVRIRADRSQTALLVADDEGTFEEFYVNVTSPRADAWQTALEAYPEFDCSLDTSGPVDRASCVAEDPERVQVPLIRVDVELTS